MIKVFNHKKRLQSTNKDLRFSLAWTTLCFICKNKRKSFKSVSVPSEDPSGESLVLPRDQFYRILQASRVLSKEDREAEAEKIKREKERAMVSCLVNERNKKPICG